MPRWSGSWYAPIKKYTRRPRNTRPISARPRMYWLSTVWRRPRGCAACSRDLRLWRLPSAQSMGMEATFKIAAPSETDLLVALMQEFYACEHLAFDAGVARAGLEKLLANTACGRAWLIQSEQRLIGYVVLV